MSRADELRRMARSDPAVYLQAAVEAGVLEAAGYLRDDDGRLDAAVVQWWPDAHPGRDQLYRAGHLLKAPAPEVLPLSRRATSDCMTGKVQYASKAAAREDRDKLRRTGDATVRVYHCISCGCYHVGHTSRADKREALR